MGTIRGPLMATACSDRASMPSAFVPSRGRKGRHVSAFAVPCVSPNRSRTRAEAGLIGFRAVKNGNLLPGLHGSQFLSRLPGACVVGTSPLGKSRRSVSLVVQAKNTGVDASERVLGALGYLLPFFDGIQYGRYFFLQYPLAENFVRPLYPILAAYKGFPYSNFIAFFALYLLVVRNQSLSRYVRFNAMQAVVLDVLLIFPTLVERTFAPRGGIGFELLIIFYNTVFIFLVACFLFGVGSCILGKTPRLPIVADAADAQV